MTESSDDTNDPGGLPPEDPPEGEAANGVAGAATPADPPAEPPVTDRHASRVRENLENKKRIKDENDAARREGRKPSKERTGFVNVSADEKWEEEVIPVVREVERVELKDCRIDVYQVEPAPRASGTTGGRKHLGYFYGSDVAGGFGKGAGAAFNDYMIDNFHIPLDQGEARYRIIFRLVQGGKVLGDGEVTYDTPENIRKIRTAQARSTQSRPVGRTGPGAYVPPPQAPGYGEPESFAHQAPPQGAPPQAAPPAQPAAQADTKVYEELGYLRRVKEEADRARAEGRPPGYVAPPAGVVEPPLTAKSVVELVVQVLDERDKRAAAAQAAIPPPPAVAPPSPPPPPPTPVEQARRHLQDLQDMDEVMHHYKETIDKAHQRLHPTPEADAFVDDGAPANPAAVVDDGIPFNVEDVPGVSYKGEPVRWVQTKDGRTMEPLESVMAWASANPGITERFAERIINLGERIVDATTIDAEGHTVEDKPKPQEEERANPWKD